MLSVVVDTREPEAVRRLPFGGAPKLSMQLEAGDVLVNCADGSLICIERKTASDLLGTIRSGRLFSQIQRMRLLTPWCYLVIVGPLNATQDGFVVADGRESAWTWVSLQGALLTVQELGCAIVMVPSEAEFETAVLRLANRSHEAVRIAPVRDPDVLSEGEGILAALPGVGVERARSLLTQCGSVGDALAWLTDDTRNGAEPIAGIGIGIKRKVRRALGLLDHSVLGVTLKDLNWLMANWKEEDEQFSDTTGNDFGLADDHGNSTGHEGIAAI